MADNVFAQLAVGILYLLRLLLALISVIFGFIGCLLPWRFIALLDYRDVMDDLDNFTMTGFALFAIALGDLLLIIPFILTLISWRGHYMLTRVRKRLEFCDTSRDFACNFKLREKILKSFCLMISDIPYIVMSLLNICMIWRCPFYIKELTEDGNDMKKLTIQNFAIGSLELITLPFLIPSFICFYRLPAVYEALTDSSDYARGTTGILQRRLEIVLQGLWSVIDIATGIVVLISCAMLVRIPSIVRKLWLVKEGKPVKNIRRLLLLEFLLSFRELLALVVYVILLPTGYRFYLAISSVIEQCSSRADPTPHASITSFQISFPPEKGVVFTISGTKTPDLKPSVAKLYIENESFWKSLGSVGSVAKTFFPYKLTPAVLDVESFKEGETEFQCELRFKAGSKKGITKQLMKVPSLNFMDVTIEFGNHEGTLLHFKASFSMILSCCDGAVVAPPNQPDCSAIASTTTAEISEAGSRREGKLFCDVMAMPAFVQLALLLCDIFGVVLFVLLHLFPFRVFTLYSILCESKENSKLRAIKKISRDVITILNLHQHVITQAMEDIDNDAKCNRTGVFSGSQYQWWRSSVNEGSDISKYLNQLSQLQNKLIELEGTSLTTELSNMISRHCEETKLRILYYAKATIEYYRFVNGNAATLQCKSSLVTLKYLQPSDVFPWLGTSGVQELQLSDSSTDKKLPIDLVLELAPRPKSGGMAKLKTVTTPVRSDRAFQLHGEAVSQEITIYEKTLLKFKEVCLLKNLPDINSSQSKQRKSWGQIRSIIYKTTKEFASDIFAFISFLILTATVYRLYSLYNSYSSAMRGEKRPVFRKQLLEVALDFAYFFKAILVVALLRYAGPMLADVVEFTSQKRSFQAARMVVDHYARMTLRDMHEFFVFLLTWETLYWSLACFIFGIILPGTLVVIQASEFFGITSNAGGRGFFWIIILLLSGSIYGSVLGTCTLSNSDPTVPAVTTSAVVVLYMFVLYIFGLKNHRESAELVSSKFLRINWINCMQFLFAILEGCQLVAICVLDKLQRDPSTHLPEWLITASKYCLLKVSSSDTSGVLSQSYIAVVVSLVFSCLYYLLSAVPAAALARGKISSSNQLSSFVRHTTWVFLMEFIGTGLQVLLIYSMTEFVTCTSCKASCEYSCWEGDHRGFSFFAMSCLLFFTIASYGKVPEYTQARSCVLDIAFIERYNMPVRGILIVISALSGSHLSWIPDSCYLVIAYCVWAMLFSMIPRLSGVKRICSSEQFVVLKVLISGGVVSAASFLKFDRNAGIIISSIVGAAVAIFMYSLRSRSVDEMVVSPESAQAELLSIFKLLNANELLFSSFNAESWPSKIKGANRVSQLCYLLIKLEYHTKYRALHPLFINTRRGWYEIVNKKIAVDDFNRDYEYKFQDDDSDSDCCECGCCDSDDEIDDTSFNIGINTPDEFKRLSERLQQFKNGIIIPERPRSPSDICYSCDSSSTTVSVADQNEDSGEACQVSGGDANPSSLPYNLMSGNSQPSQTDHTVVSIQPTDVSPGGSGLQHVLMDSQALDDEAIQ